MLTFFLNKLQQAPAGFNYNDVGQWLQDVPYIQQLSSIKPLFFEQLSKKELMALITLLKYRYIKEGPAYNLFDDSYQTAFQENNIADLYSSLSIYDDNSQLLDFSPLTKTLTKLIVSTCKGVEKIILPAGKQLEALEFSYLPELVEFGQLEQVKGLMYLAINKCSKIADFSFIKSFKKLICLELSGNGRLTHLTFLSASSQVVVLQLLDTQLLDDPKTVKQLLKLKHLKYLTISGKQQQIQQLREQLPNCVVNGISAYKTTLSLL